MPSEGPSIPSSTSGSAGIGPARPRDGGARPVAPRTQSRTRRLFVDPHDIDAAIDRLAQLLAADTDGPRSNVSPGFYLNILV